MATDKEIIGYDFQGWPIWKKTLRKILEEIGAEVFRDENGNDILGFKNDSKILDVYPTTLEDDGMGYGVEEMYITEGDWNPKANILHIWRNTKEIKDNDETIN